MWKRVHCAADVIYPLILLLLVYSSGVEALPSVNFTVSASVVNGCVVSGASTSSFGTLDFGTQPGVGLSLIHI